VTTKQTQDYQLSLPSAVFININIMLGAGIFINTSTLAQRAGVLGAFMYLFVGMLMLPLILSIAKLLKLHPSGGFYTFAQKEISPFAGFFSGWSYFTAKLASCMLMIHVSVMLIQQIFPLLAQIHAFLLDFIVVSSFILLNLLNIKAGTAIQKMFIGLKTFPIFFAIATGLFLIQGENFSSSHLTWEGIPSSLPLVIYAIIGFEAACSLSSKIKDPDKNAPLAVLISFGTVILIATLYQVIFYGALGMQLALCGGHCNTFPTLLNALFGDTPFTNRFAGILHLAIAFSTLGGAYGILFSNSWNLHILAQNQHLWFSKTVSKLNRHAIPFICVAIEGLICLTYLAVSQGKLIPLQQIGALGCVISYTFSVAALLQAIKKQPARSHSLWIPSLGLVSCTLLITACIRCFFKDGMNSLIIYSFFLLIGIGMFFMTSKASKKISLTQ
jgi:amino acid transporter